MTREQFENIMLDKSISDQEAFEAVPKYLDDSGERTKQEVEDYYEFVVKNRPEVAKMIFAYGIDTHRGCCSRDLSGADAEVVKKSYSAKIDIQHRELNGHKVSDAELENAKRLHDESIQLQDDLRNKHH